MSEQLLIIGNCGKCGLGGNPKSNFSREGIGDLGREEEEIKISNS